MDTFENNLGDSPREPSPHHLSRRVIIVAIVFFCLIVAGMFTFAFLKKTEIQESNIEDSLVQLSAEVKYAAISRIEAKHFYIDCVHTIAGELAMPTPCDLLQNEVMVAESYPEQIFIDFTVNKYIRNMYAVSYSRSI